MDHCSIIIMEEPSNLDNMAKWSMLIYFKNHDSYPQRVWKCHYYIFGI